MFPFDEEDTREWTEYGFALRPGDFRRVRGTPSGRATAHLGLSMNQGGVAPARVLCTTPVICGATARLGSPSILEPKDRAWGCRCVQAQPLACRAGRGF